jgi:hypothetical protein
MYHILPTSHQSVSTLSKFGCILNFDKVEMFLVGRRKNYAFSKKKRYIMHVGRLEDDDIVASGWAGDGNSNCNNVFLVCLTEGSVALVKPSGAPRVEWLLVGEGRLSMESVEAKAPCAGRGERAGLTSLLRPRNGGR